MPAHKSFIMKIKSVSGIVLTIIGALGIIYGIISELDSFMSKGPLMGIILLSVFMFFVGVSLLRGAYEEH